MTMNSNKRKPLISNDLGKLPPQAIDLEEGVLGALLLDKKAIYEVFTILKEDSFYKEENRLLYRVIMKCQADGLAIDILIVTQTAKKMGLLDLIGGAYSITQMTNRVASAAHITTHARIIEQQAIKRRIITFAAQIMNKGYDETTDSFELLADVASFLNKPEFSFNFADPSPTFRLKEAMEAIKDAQIHEKPPGLTLGRPKIDNSIRGFKNGDYWVIAGRPGMGKTAIAMAISKLISDSYGAIFWKQLEMSSLQTALREISAQTGLSVARLTSGKMNDIDYNATLAVVDELSKKSKIYVDTDPFMDIGNLKASCTRAVNEYKAKMIIIDYLQLAEGIHDDKNREQVISRISRTIKLTAKSLGVPIIALAQLSRAVESRPNKRPQLSDLRECLSVRTSNIYTNKEFQCNTTSPINLLSLSKLKIKNMKSENIPKSENDVFRLKLKTGRFIDCTAKHQILTSDGYKMLQDINVTDAVAVATNWENENGIYVSESKFIGWMLGNGSMYGYGVPCFITKDKIISDNFCKFIFDRFGFYPKDHPHFLSKVYQWDITNSPTGNRTKQGNIVTTWLKEKDLWGRKSMNKYIPQWWMESANEQSIRELLQGLWETDGSIALGKKRETISYSTTSLILANQILYLTAKLGIVCHLDNGHKSVKATVKCYKITISSSSQKKNFISKIKLDGEKGDKLSRLNLTERQSYYSDVLGRETTLNIEQYIKSYTTKRYVNSYQNRRLTKCSLKSILTKIGISEAKEKYNWLLSDSIFWDGVESIEHLGVEPVFDRSVPVSNNFVVNGIIVHNSGSIEQDADGVMFLYRPEYYEIQEIQNEHKQMVSSKNKIEIIIAKNRQGPTGSILEDFDIATNRFIDNTPQADFSHRITPNKDAEKDAPF